MIDWNRVAELQGEFGIEGFVEVADMFLEEAEQAVRLLVAGMPHEQVEGQLHFLKGSALNLGLTDLAQICQEGERKAAEGRAGEVDLGRIVLVYRRSRQCLLGGLAAGTAA